MAIVSIGATLLICLPLEGALSGNRPLSLFIIPVVISAWFGGLGPGLLATALSGLASEYFLTERHFTISIMDTADWERWMLFLATSGLINWLILMMRAARQEVEARARDAVQRQIELEEQITERERARAEREQLIAERERLIAELETERACLKAIVENIPAGVILAEAPGGRIVMTNPQVEQILGRPMVMSPGIESYREWLTYEVNGRPIEGRESVLARTLQGEVAPGRDILFHRGDGRKAWIRVSGAPIRDASDKIVGGVDLITDIDEEKRAREALRLNQERLNLAQKTARLGSFEWNIQTDEVIWSEETEAIYGLPPGGFSGGYKAWAKRVHPEDWSVAEEAMRRAVVDGRQYDAEYRAIWPDGSVHWLQTRGKVFFDDEGRPLRLIGVDIDVTERKRAEEKLRESESRLRQHMDAMPQMVYTCTTDGKADYVNRRWQEYTGLSCEQSLGAGWVERLHPDDRERVGRQWAKTVKAGQPFETEYRLRRNDGQYRWHLSRAIPICDERRQIVKWIGTLTDIHDRKEVEAEREELLVREQAARAAAERAAESIRRLQAVTDSALTHLTLDGLLHEMLARIRELLETDSAAILLLTEDGQSLSVRAAIGLEEVGTPHVPVGRGVAGSIAASRAPLIVEDLSTVEVIHPILRQKARSLIGAPLIVEDRLIGVIRADTTQVRRFTEDDVRLLQLAADRVALAIEQARLYEVELQARQQAEEANHMKDEFLALVSHELRSPLNAMLGYAALLRHGRLDAQKAKQAVDVIERSGKAQAQLIDDLLDTARIISGKLRLDLGPVDLVSVIEQAVQTIQPAAGAKEISIVANLPSEIVQITGDPARLQQVVWNLLSNAVKFTPQKGHVEVRLDRIDPHICIIVSDTGKGISPDFMPYIFDRFRQSDASSARRYGGLGLGLALVKYLVELHGGTIEAASAGEGQGATFNVTLPVRAVTTPLEEAGGAPVTIKSSGELMGVRALVVDDEDDARELLELTLTQYGADVVAVSSSAEAYTLITATPPQERPDVMVSDIGMPDEDGCSLMRRVREWERERDFYTPAVALTAYGRTEDRVRALKAGFQTHIAKPVDPTELAIVIESLIRRSNRGEKA
jgi:PAS domain S-box-containing protein